MASPEFRQGFKAVLPLWLAAAPFAFAYVVAAQKAGLSALEIQLMSLTMYSGAAQIATTQFLSGGASVMAIVTTAVLINLHHALYGLSFMRRLPLSRIQSMLGAYFISDVAYGVSMAAKSLSFDFLFGAELSLFLSWNVCTALGLFVGSMIVLPAWMQLDFIVPLSFFVLLVSSTKTWLDAAIVGLSALVALGCLLLQLGSLTLIIVAITGALAGEWLSQRYAPHRDIVSRQAES